MNDSNTLSALVNPIVQSYQPKSVLTIGALAKDCVQLTDDTRFNHLGTPENVTQLQQVGRIDLAVVSHLVEYTDKEMAEKWLGLLKNFYTSHLILIVHPDLAKQNGWVLTDYLAFGFKHLAGSNDGLQLFSYAIENYQPKREWLNNRYWANPELYDKYRW